MTPCRIAPRRATRMLLLGLAALALGQSPAFAQTNAPLLKQSDLVYEGAFRVPAGTSEKDTFNYGGTALAYNPANNSLFMTGHDWYQYTAEIKIPAIVNSNNVNSLNTATIIQSFRDPLEGRINSINPSDGNSKKIGGHLVYNGKLYITAYSYYDGMGSQSSSHFVRSSTSLSSGGVQGPYKVGSLYPGFVHGYMALVPPEWQSLLGGPALTGHCCLSITSTQSNGPAVSVFDPAKLGSGGTVPATPLVGYPYPNVLGPGEDTQNNYFNLATKISGVVFPYGTRTVMFFGRQGTGRYCYGDGAACGDPTDSSKGTHAYPYTYQIWAYDANDLLAVKNGSKQQYQVQPYGLWRFSLPFENNAGARLIGGTAYDPATQRIYISQRCATGECSPVIHVFKVNAGKAEPAPKPPTNVSVQ
jgi:hypothetical protein